MTTIATTPRCVVPLNSTPAAEYLASEFSLSSPNLSPTRFLTEEEHYRLAVLIPPDSPAADEGIPARYSALRDLIMTYDLDPFEYSDEDLCDLAAAIFYHYGIPQMFKIPESRLRAFVRTVRDSYRSSDEVIFHNFKHVYNVLHLAFHLLKSGVDQKLTAFDVFALLVAALCHDMDHPGVSNSFMISSHSDLANLYSNDSVLERHHAYLVRRLLLFGGRNARSGVGDVGVGGSSPSPSKVGAGDSSGGSTDILCGLNSDDRRHFIGLVTHAILATDMTHHMKKVEYFQSRSAFADARETSDLQRKELLRGILHTVDIGAQSHATPLAARWGRIVGQEFSAQYEKEIKLGLPPSLFMADLGEEHKLALLQSGFVANIVLPLWTAVADSFPNLQPRVLQLHENLHYYLSKVPPSILSPPSSPLG